MKGDRIELFRGENCWLARTTGPGAARVVELFGCDTLPTAFRPELGGEAVRAAVAALNPCVEVYVRPALDVSVCEVCGERGHLLCGSIVEGVSRG